MLLSSFRESSPDDVHRTRRFIHLQKKEAFPRSLVCKPAITAPTDSTSKLQKATRSWQRQVRCDTAQTTFRHRARESQHSWLAEASCWHLAGVTSLQCYHRRYSVCVRHSQKKRKKLAQTCEQISRQRKSYKPNVKLCTGAQWHFMLKKLYSDFSTITAEVTVLESLASNLQGEKRLG